jgi:hypothetical protein
MNCRQAMARASGSARVTFSLLVLVRASGSQYCIRSRLFNALDYGSATTISKKFLK